MGLLAKTHIDDVSKDCWRQIAALAITHYRSNIAAAIQAAFHRTIWINLVMTSAYHHSIVVQDRLDDKMLRFKRLISLLFAFALCGRFAAAAPLAPFHGLKGPKEVQNLKTSTEPGWTSKCVSESRSAPLVCSVEETLVLARTDQAVVTAAVRVQPTKGEPVLLMQVPLGLYLPAGLSLKIDDGKPQRVPLQTCNAHGCYAEKTLNARLIFALEAGKNLSISCENLAKNNLVFSLPLGSFAAAYHKVQ